jgi:hypothetical protein
MPPKFHLLTYDIFKTNTREPLRITAYSNTLCPSRVASPVLHRQRFLYPPLVTLLRRAIVATVVGPGQIGSSLPLLGQDFPARYCLSLVPLDPACGALSGQQEFPLVAPMGDMPHITWNVMPVGPGHPENS